MTSLQHRPMADAPAVAAPHTTPAPPATIAPVDTAPPLPDAWVRKVARADHRLQRQMRVVVAGAIVAFAAWVGWTVLF